jgi:hypothetical protein
VIESPYVFHGSNRLFVGRFLQPLKLLRLSFIVPTRASFGEDQTDNFCFSSDGFRKHDKAGHGISKTSSSLEFLLHTLFWISRWNLISYIIQMLKMK